MVNETVQVTIEIDPQSDLAKVLAAAIETPILLISNGNRYIVRRAEDDRWKDYDPERVRAAFREAAGSLTPEEAEELRELVYRGCEEGTRPLDRPCGIRSTPTG
jgi:hypothetical protein